MRYLLLGLLFVGCGTKNTVSGQVNVVHQIDIAGAVKQIDDACKAQYPDKASQDACFHSLTQQFFGILLPKQ